MKEKQEKIIKIKIASFNKKDLTNNNKKALFMIVINMLD